MDQSINLSVNERIVKAFQIKMRDAKSCSPLTLAYIGDCVYELAVRTYLVNKHNISPHDLSVEAFKLVNAKTQAAIIDHLMPELSEEEMQFYKKGRNAKSPSSPKNASIIEYRHATGFEALVGFLYMDGREERMIDLIKKGIDFYYGR